MALSMATRKQITKEMARRYARARKGERGRMLDELCALTGYNRGYAARLLRSGGGAPTARSRQRPRTYGAETREPLRKLWATAGGICGKRLAPFLPELVAALERHGELELSEEQRAKLCAISAASVDRLLAAERRRLTLRGRATTRPGSLLRNQIPVRTFAEWDQGRAGFVEVDLVAHDGGVARGEFAYSLDLTDVASGWTEVRAVRNRAQRWTFEALTAIAARLPFPLLGLDSDNGGEFINAQLVRYCTEHEISFTRSRPYRKNDNCYVEQKNWTVVRRTVGWARFDTEAELATLNRLYDSLRLYVNYFQPQVKLTAKERCGSRLRKRYDTATTPYRRGCSPWARSPMTWRGVSRRSTVARTRWRCGARSPDCSAASSSSPHSRKRPGERRCRPALPLEHLPREATTETYEYFLT